MVAAEEFHLNKVFRKLGISSRRPITSRIAVDGLLGYGWANGQKMNLRLVFPQGQL